MLTQDRVKSTQDLKGGFSVEFHINNGRKVSLPYLSTPMCYSHSYLLLLFILKAHYHHLTNRVMLSMVSGKQEEGTFSCISIFSSHVT